MPPPITKLFQLFADLLSRIQNGAAAIAAHLWDSESSVANLFLGDNPLLLTPSSGSAERRAMRRSPSFSKLCSGTVRLSYRRSNLSRLHELL